MKIALLSDVHANLQALEACLADARARGATHHAFLGDLVGYGADPGPVLEIVMRHAEAGAWVVRGNHDALAVSPPAIATRVAHAGAPWTHEQLSREELEFLAAQPLTARMGDILFVHASVEDPERWVYVDNAIAATSSLHAAAAEGARLVFGGHVHAQRLFYNGAGGRVMAFEPTPGIPIPVLAHRRWLATIGSVGQPRDGNPEAGYALLDTTGHRLTFLRVPYDHGAAAAAILKAGLSTFDADRLARGR